ncbi:Dfp1/Him1, central region-domain-containing protein [Phaeosphaeria sp. MPI-PUGE-AT-0046c]|nr:Dfp1/Him1, central region-domain-containing protein [Phaeosphaeria sp. MPI-PUGE-AT-0046c]
MSSRRMPLASLNNATNSPLRATAPAVGSKRQRSHASEQRDVLYGQPALKKQMIQVDDAEARRHGLVRRTGAPQTALTRKLEAARETKAPPKQTQANSDLSTLVAWVRHYKKLFPQFVFYFDSVSSSHKDKIMSRAHILGSREIAFFSKEATHVITTRPIPADIDSSSSAYAKGTINPNQLDSRKSAFDAALQKQSGRGDAILYKAKELGMKIWSVDKLQRMIETMFNKETGEDPASYQARHGTATAQPKGRPADLQRLLQNEKMDRDYTLASQELIALRGYYVYVHDMDEATRPVMIREYQKVEKEKGKWPQFRASGNGKCPFVDDPHVGRRQQEEEARRQQRAAAAAAAPRTRAASAMEEKVALGENDNLARRPSAPATLIKAEDEEDSKPLDPPKAIPTKRASTDSAPPMFGSAQANIRAMPRFIAGEPIASGLQASNITSAIRSQMISSTAAAPRAGNSKEVNALKRKVLEKNSVPSANTNSGHSSAMNDVRAMLNQEHVPPVRAAKRKAQETLGLGNDDGESEKQARKAAALRRRKTAEKELKPGYCENCREKFNDFDEHIVSRKHRKFAITTENWAELDQLLAQLDRR